MAKDFPTIKLREMIVDNTCMQLASNPEQFDVMVGHPTCTCICRAERVSIAAVLHLLLYPPPRRHVPHWHVGGSNAQCFRTHVRFSGS